MEFREVPGFASVVGEGEVGSVGGGVLVVSTGDYAFAGVAEGDRKNSGGVGAVNDGSVEDLPGSAVIGGVEDAGGFASGGEPDVGIVGVRGGGRGPSTAQLPALRLSNRSARDDRVGTENGQAGVGGSEGAFAFEGFGELLGRELMPRFAVIGDEQFEFWSAVFVGDGIAENDSVVRIPEGDGIEKSLGIGVGELELPVQACVRSVIDAGLIAGAGGHEESFVGGEGDDSAEVERGGTGDLSGSPGAACVDCAEISAVGAACPDDFLGDGADASEVFGGVGILQGWRLGGDGGSEE